MMRVVGTIARLGLAPDGFFNDGVPELNGRTCVQYAMEHVRYDMIEFLFTLKRNDDVDLFDVNSRAGWSRLTPLLDAVSVGNTDIVGILSRHPKVELNAQDDHGNTHLHLALKLFGKLGRVNMVKFLLDLDGVDVDIENDDGLTPLELALELNRARAAELLRGHCTQPM